MMSRALACGFLLFSHCVYGQNNVLERPAADFNSKDVGLTEALLRFAHQEHLPIAIEYVDRASIDHPTDASLKNKTIRQALDSILLNGNGYHWTLQDGIIDVTNRHVSKRAEDQLNRVIPDFDIGDRATVALTSTMLWWSLQIVLDPSLKNKGILGDFMGRSSPMKPATLHNRTVRQILSYIVLNSRAEGWIVAGPPQCLGYTPYCGLWFIFEGEPFDNSYQLILKEIRQNR